MPSPVQLSLCIASTGTSPTEEARRNEFSQNVTAFFHKFPVTYEVLFATAPGKRAKSLVETLAKAQGDILMVMDLDLSIPLSECFKILEIFYSDESVQAVFGDRTQKKKKLENTQYRTELTGLEGFFGGIIREKAQWKFQDPFCPVFALRKSSFEKIRGELKPRGWHLTPELQRVAQNQGLVTQEVAVYAGSRQNQSAPPWTEFWGLLNFVLFRI
jgi:hypothetical protein